MKKKTLTITILAIIILLITSVVIIYIRTNDKSNNNTNKTEQTEGNVGLDAQVLKQVQELNTQVYEINKVLIKIKRNHAILTLLIITTFILFVLSFFIKSKSYKHHNNRSKYSIDDFESDIKNKVIRLEAKVNESYSSTRGLYRKVENIENKFSGLHESIQMSTNEASVNQMSTPKEENDTDNRSIAPSKTKYLKGKTGDKFKREVDIEDSETFYSLEKNGNIGSFQFCGNQENALGNFNAIFDNVCDYEGDPSRAKKIVNVESGQVELIEGNWKVIIKAKIKVE